MEWSVAARDVPCVTLQVLLTRAMCPSVRRQGMPLSLERRKHTKKVQVPLSVTVMTVLRCYHLHKLPG